MIQTIAKVIDNQQLTEDCWRLTLHTPEIASMARPGQFVNVKISGPREMLLRRPFSILRNLELEVGSGGIELVYRVVGHGTRLMVGLKSGDALDIIGPLGHGFEWRRDKEAHVLLGGGVGLSALFMLGEEISRKTEKLGLKLFVLLGAQTKKKLMLQQEFAALGGEVLVSTDDGSFGYRGFVTEALRAAIVNGKVPSDCAIYSCGPEAMYKALAGICQQHQIPAQVCIEKRMMCGFGACLTCICKVDKANILKGRDLASSHIQFVPEEEFGYALVCKDGPVFGLDEVILD